MTTPFFIASEPNVSLNFASPSVALLTVNLFIAFQQYEFKTYSGLSFSYQLKLGKNGNYTKELFIDRRENSKSLSWSSIRLAFKKVAEIKSSTGEKMPTIGRPKALGDIRGVTYIYAIFFRLGLIEVPDNVKEKMEGNTSAE